MWRWLKHEPAYYIPDIAKEWMIVRAEALARKRSWFRLWPEGW